MGNTPKKKAISDCNSVFGYILEMRVCLETQLDVQYLNNHYMFGQKLSLISSGVI